MIKKPISKFIIFLHNRLRSEVHTSELQSPCNLVCRLLLEKKKCYFIGDQANSNTFITAFDFRFGTYFIHNKVVTNKKADSTRLRG